MNHAGEARRLRRIGMTLILLGSSFILAQALIRWSADYYLRARAKIPLHIGRLFINPATSRVTLGLKGSDPGQMLLVDLGQVRFDWWTVIRRRLRLGSVALDGIQLEIERRADGSLRVGGIDIPKSTPTAQAVSTKPAAKPWGVGLGGIKLDHIALRYKDPLVDLDLRIRHFSMAAAESWHPDRGSPFEGDFLVNGATLSIHGDAYPFQKTPGGVLQLDLRGLPLDWLGPLAHASGITKLSGFLGASAEIHLSLNPENGQISASWNGPIELKDVAVGGPATGLSEARFSGTLALENVSVELSSTTPAIVRAKAIGLPAPNSLSLSDRRMDPAFRWTLSPLEFRIENIDTSSSETMSRLKVLAHPSKHEKIDLQGRWALLSKVPNGEITLIVDGLNLSAFSPYVEKSIGWRIRSGLFDHKTKAQFDHGKLQSENSFTAHTFYLDKLGQEDLQGETAQLGLPLGLALGLLRDADDNIRLAVPVDGDLTDPQVPKWSLIWTILGKAVRAAARAAVTSFFPSGTHIGFDPVLFSPGQVTLLPEAADYLSKAAQKLIQHPQVSLKVTGYAALDDAYALLRKKKDPNKLIDMNTLPADLKEKLLNLASQRAETIQAQLAVLGLDPKRVAFTPPVIDLKSDSTPKAEISL